MQSNESLKTTQAAATSVLIVFYECHEAVFPVEEAFRHSLSQMLGCNSSDGRHPRDSMNVEAGCIEAS